MSDDPKKPVWPWIAVLLIGLPVLYVASFGPVMWFIDLTQKPYRWARRVYWPLGKLTVEGPDFIRHPLATYVRAYAPKRQVLDFEGYLVPVGPNQFDMFSDTEP